MRISFGFFRLSLCMCVFEQGFREVLNILECLSVWCFLLQHVFFDSTRSLDLHMFVLHILDDILFRQNSVGQILNVSNILF